MFISHSLKSFILIFILIALSSILFGCGVEEKKKIYDNGKSISQEGDSFSFRNRTGESDEKHFDIKYDRFYGVQTLWVIETEENNEIKLYYSSLVKSGHFKIVLVTPKQEVINIAEQNSKGSFSTVTSKGKYRVKIVGSNANGNIKIDLSTHEGNKVLVHQNDL